MTTPNDLMSERIIRFTVDLPESLHEQLTQKAIELQQKKAPMVRFAIVQMLKDLNDHAVIE
jgi:predicted DNA-binding protein